jgi:NitT/TauT family transport system substrate-binding protein
MRRLVAFFPLAAALLLGAATGWSAGQQQPSLRILVPQTTAALPFLIMARDQSVADAGISVDFFANHAQALAVLLRGDAELLLSGTSQGWENRLDGSPLVMVDSGVWGISSLVGRDAAIAGFADLKGRRIAMPFPGSPLDFQSRALLAFEKLDPDRDVAFSYGPFAQSLQRLQAGQVDAVALPEPLATSVVRQNGLKRLVDYSRAWARLTGGDPRSPQVSLFASDRYAADHRSLMASVVAAWDAATRAVNADPAAAAAQFASALAVDAATLEEATRNTLLAVPSPAENRTRVMAYYALVARYLPAGNRPLDSRFFFVP